ncbi:hypothetical protein C819_03000 [Lachnospiraceae bacterium 10-1]|nr:hypothetical protein C819_03000 [Lachnospiraceae bacterium 10-1]
MVIARLSPGLANQMMEYAASYALAEELEQELVLDIAECKNSSWGYLIDFFDIPDTKKISYFLVDAEQAGHVNINGIPEALKKKVTIFTAEGQSGTKEYKGLDIIPELERKSDIYMCGYFFNRSWYYEKYWETIRKNFSLRIEIKEVQRFKELIKNKISVGVHIRRGDMLLADWAEKMEGDYYKAAIAYCRKYFGDCIFCVFSDDLNYVKNLLGKDDSIYYIHFLGYDDADIAEFICLSLCSHRILSNSSTFGRLADELNGGKERYTFYQGIMESKTFWWYHIKKMFMERGNKRQLDKWDIQKFAPLYECNNRENILNWRKKVDQIINNITLTNGKDKEILNEISEVCLNMYGASTEDEKKLLYCKFIALTRLEKYHDALMAAYPIYEIYVDDLLYRKSLVKALKGIGADKEAELELKWEKSEKHFIIVPKVKSFASSKKYGLIELGIVLYHMGHNVSFIFEPIDESEQYYIQKNKILTDRHGIGSGCFQYLKQEIKDQGFDNFLMEQTEDELIVITRDGDFCGQRAKNKKIKYIFPDYSDVRDAETRAGRKTPKEELEYLYDMSDMILAYASENLDFNGKLVLWGDDDHKEEYWIEEKRLKFGDLHRMDERVICMAQAIVNNI